jgi:hypothetical protein
MPNNKKEVLAAALDQTNLWLKGQEHPFYLVLPEGMTEAKKLIKDLQRADNQRRVHWDWEHLYSREVRLKPAWMYAMVREKPGAMHVRAMCCGRIEVKDRYVSIEYLERVGSDPELKGLTALTAFQFARTVALLLDIDEVRLNDPFPELVPYYEQTLGVVRHPQEGSQQYLYIKVQA